MKTLLTACLILTFTAVSLAQTNLHLLSITNSLSVGEILSKEKRLSTIESLPPSVDINNVVVSESMNMGRGGKLTADGFRTLMDRATPLKADDPSIFVYHYAPWCIVTFDTKDGKHIANVCLGRGFLQYPDGRVLAFATPQPSSEKEISQNVADTTLMSEAKGFVRQVVQSLIEGESKVAFPVADIVFAIDNGELLPKADFQNVWPQFASKAIPKKVSLEQFFRDVDIRISSPLNNKRLMSNKRVLESYKYQEGDLYCDASQVKEGVVNFITYDKAFIYIIRKVGKKWTLIGIGG